MAGQIVTLPPENGRSINGPVIQNMSGITLSANDVRGLLNHVGNAYPELSDAMDAANRLIVHLETLRHEALLPLSLGRQEDVKRLLKQPAVVQA